MEVLNQDEINIIVNSSMNSDFKILNWSLANYADHLIGYLGEHLKLTVEIENNNDTQELRYFVKCMPRFNNWKAQYLKKMPFFDKEFRMLSSLFTHFRHAEGKWQVAFYTFHINVYIYIYKYK